MSNVRPFLIMDTSQAAQLCEFTQGQTSQLDPRLVDAGPHKGKWVLPWRVCNDEQHFKLHNILWGLPEADLALEEAWPEPQEGGFLNKVKNLIWGA